MVASVGGRIWPDERRIFPPTLSRIVATSKEIENQWIPGFANAVVDLFEEKDNVVVKAEMPGLEK